MNPRFRSPSPEKAFRPGFRFLPHDRWVVIALVALSAVIWHFAGLAALPFCAVFLQFFLFCNVFRVRTSLELLWVALTAPLAFWMTAREFPPWFLAALLLSTGIFPVAVQIGSPLYCGVLWGKINPGLGRNRARAGL